MYQLLTINNLKIMLDKLDLLLYNKRCKVNNAQKGGNNMAQMKTKFEMVKAIISENWDDGQKVYAWNERCDNLKYYDDRIEYNNIDELLMDCKPSEVIQKIDTANYRLNDEYAVCTIYGWKSFNYADDENSPYDNDEMARYIVDRGECFGDSDLEELFEEEEEE